MKCMTYDSRDIQLVESFNQLAKDVFGIDFSLWYNHGYWNEDYIPYSFVVEDEVVANASVYRMTLTDGTSDYRAIQIGTVMTHPDYRGQGLSKALIDQILDEYTEKVDMIYLFANDTVLDFYPQFGFRRHNESQITLDTRAWKIDDGVPPVLFEKISLDENRKLVERVVKNRRLMSNSLGVKDNANLFMFYAQVVFSERMYYSEELDTLIMMEVDGTDCHLYDVVWTKDRDLSKVLPYMVPLECTRVVFHFNPREELAGIKRESYSDDDDALFIQMNTSIGREYVKFPLTSHC
ncbi:MAG: GNAT family N-acetyltransferase [Vagococcus sp.]